jgi:hypothetical protein
MRAPQPQEYPRIREGEKFSGYLDEQRVAPHRRKVTPEKLRRIIVDAIRNASHKSSRVILEIPKGTSDEQMRKIYLREGRRLFDYFRKYCGDPASIAYEYRGRHYREVAIEQFRNRTLQKERMNSGWRYQFMASECAKLTNQPKLAATIDSMDEVDVCSWNFSSYLEQAAGVSCERIMNLVFVVLINDAKGLVPAHPLNPPRALLSTFGKVCRQHRLVDAEGRFNDARKLLQLLCAA